LIEGISWRNLALPKQEKLMSRKTKPKTSKPHARRKASHPAAVLFAAVKAGDEAKVRALLGAGVDPLVFYKSECVVEVATLSGQADLVRPFVEALRRETSPLSTCSLGCIALRAFMDDRFSVAFAAEMVGDAKPDINMPDVNPREAWGALLEHCEAIDSSGQPPVPRVPSRLAGKVRLAIEQGWQVERAWHGGWLPHHTYLDKGFVEAAVMCVVDGGADPDAPCFHEGIVSPENFDAWPAFQSALRAHRTN